MVHVFIVVCVVLPFCFVFWVDADGGAWYLLFGLVFLLCCCVLLWEWVCDYYYLVCVIVVLR